MHIYDFITDDEQYKLKNASRYGTDQPFEQALIAYRDNFLEQLKKCTSHENSNYLGDDLKKNPGLKIWFEEFNDLVQKNADQIESLINDLLTVYNVFIGGQHQTAVSLLAYYLEKYDLLDISYHELLGCHLRGRWIQTGDNITEESYYFHIPTNKRHLIRNQRFSFSGIPILYVGESLATVFYELGANNLEEKRIAIATFNYNQFATLHINSDWENFKSRSKVYNITNTIYEVINDIFFKIIERGANIGIISSIIALPPKAILRFFRKFILSQICTFPKKILIKDQHFVEEYVFPQLLTEAIKGHKYDGIVYPSTKFFDKKVDFGKGWHSKIFQANIAMFTHYNPYLVYDEELFKNFDPMFFHLKISKPLMHMKY